MRLDVGMFCAKKSFRAVDGKLFRHINILNTVQEGH